MKVETFDQNKLYSSEILSILLQGGKEKAQEQIVKTDGMKHLIRIIARYRKLDSPARDEEELEFVENVFDCLCWAMKDHADNQEKFAKYDGITSTCIHYDVAYLLIDFS